MSQIYRWHCRLLCNQTHCTFLYFSKAPSAVDLFSRSLTHPEVATLTEQFQNFLTLLADEKTYDLRLPLQVACLISPIFLLGELLVHKCKLYRQRYKLMLACTLLFGCACSDNTFSVF
jgi:hypothetical protein